MIQVAYFSVICKGLFCLLILQFHYVYGSSPTYNIPHAIYVTFNDLST